MRALVIICVAIIAMGATCRSERRSAIDETERVRATTASAINQVVKPTPVLIETTSPDGQTTTITTAPESSTTHTLDDKTAASSTYSFSSWSSIGVGVSVFFALGIAMLAWVLWSKLTATGRASDSALGYITRRLTSIGNAERREDLLHIQNILDR